MWLTGLAFFSAALSLARLATEMAACAATAPALYPRNVLDFLKLLLPPAAKGDPPASFRIDMEDDIVAACLMAHEGAVTRK